MKKKKINEPVRVSNFWSNNYIEYESNGERSKTLSIEEYWNKIRPYLKRHKISSKNLTQGKFN